MFEKTLFHGKITWSGQTKEKDGVRVACKKFINVMKLVHAIMLTFDGDVKLEFVESFFHKTLCIFGSKRAKNKGIRDSVAKYSEKKEEYEEYEEYIEKEQLVDEDQNKGRNEGDDETENEADNQNDGAPNYHGNEEQNMTENDAFDEDVDEEAESADNIAGNSAGHILLIKPRRKRKQVSQVIEKNAKKNK